MRSAISVMTRASFTGRISSICWQNASRSAGGLNEGIAPGVWIPISSIVTSSWYAEQIEHGLKCGRKGQAARRVPRWVKNGALHGGVEAAEVKAQAEIGLAAAPEWPHRPQTRVHKGLRFLVHFGIIAAGGLPLIAVVFLPNLADVVYEDKVAAVGCLAREADHATILTVGKAELHCAPSGVRIYERGLGQLPQERARIDNNRAAGSGCRDDGLLVLPLEQKPGPVSLDL